MPNKTIYVSEKDSHLFEQAKSIAGEALSSVIVRSLSEFVTRNQNKKKGMKEIALKVGLSGTEREQRFIGTLIGKWDGFSDDKQWYQKATIFLTQKGNWVVFLETVCKASLFTNKNEWKASGDYLINPKKSELHIVKNPNDLKNVLPKSLLSTLIEYTKQVEIPIEYLDI